MAIDPGSMKSTYAGDNGLVYVKVLFRSIHDMGYPISSARSGCIWQTPSDGHALLGGLACIYPPSWSHLTFQIRWIALIQLGFHPQNVNGHFPLCVIFDKGKFIEVKSYFIYREKEKTANGPGPRGDQGPTSYAREKSPTCQSVGM